MTVIFIDDSGKGWSRLCNPVDGRLYTIPSFRYLSSILVVTA
jgi:hypothetical protein